MLGLIDKGKKLMRYGLQPGNELRGWVRNGLLM
jgi:hypothetical protein